MRTFPSFMLLTQSDLTGPDPPVQIVIQRYESLALGVHEEEGVCHHGCQMAKFDPFLSLDCAPTSSTLAQSNERKGSNFAIWQLW